jgi:hypothetical protein
MRHKYLSCKSNAVGRHAAGVLYMSAALIILLGVICLGALQLCGGGDSAASAGRSELAKRENEMVAAAEARARQDAILTA